MDLKEKINLIKKAKDDIRQAIISKGIIPSGNISTYADAIDSIQIVHNQDKIITEEGTYTCESEYSGLGTVTVQIVTNHTINNQGKKCGVPTVNGMLGLYDTSLQNTINLRDPNIGDSTIQLNLPLIKQSNCVINGQASALRSVDLSGLQNGEKVIIQFPSCLQLNTVDLSSLSNINSRTLYGAFSWCIRLVNVNLNSLATIDGSKALFESFKGCTSLKTLLFPMLTEVTHNDTFCDMLQGVKGCTVHFPSRLEAVIGSWEDVQSGFGGTNTVVLFDL